MKQENQFPSWGETRYVTGNQFQQLNQFPSWQETSYLTAKSISLLGADQLFMYVTTKSISPVGGGRPGM